MLLDARPGAARRRATCSTSAAAGVRSRSRSRCSRPGARVWAVDVNERALDLIRRNAERLGATNVRAVTPDDVPDDVALRRDLVQPADPGRQGRPCTRCSLRWLGGARRAARRTSSSARTSVPTRCSAGSRRSCGVDRRADREREGLPRPAPCATDERLAVAAPDHLEPVRADLPGGVRVAGGDHGDADGLERARRRRRCTRSRSPDRWPPASSAWSLAGPWSDRSGPRTPASRRRRPVRGGPPRRGARAHDGRAGRGSPAAGARRWRDDRRGLRRRRAALPRAAAPARVRRVRGRVGRAVARRSRRGGRASRSTSGGAGCSSASRSSWCRRRWCWSRRCARIGPPETRGDAGAARAARVGGPRGGRGARAEPRRPGAAARGLRSWRRSRRVVALVALRPLVPAGTLRAARGLPSVVATRGLVVGGVPRAPRSTSRTCSRSGTRSRRRPPGSR